MPEWPTDKFYKLPHWLLSRTDLIIEAKVIWAYLRDRQGSNGDAHPGQRRIARDCCIHPRNVVKAIGQLAKADLITVTKPTPKEAAKGHTSRYQCGSASTVVAASTVGNGSASTVETEALPPLETKLDPYNQTQQPDPIKKAVRPVKSNGAALAVEIPASLNVLKFQEAWIEWIADRKARGKPVTERAAKMQLRDLDAIGPERAVAAIEASIKNCWQGIFEPKGQENRNGQGVGRGVSAGQREHLSASDKAKGRRADAAKREFPEGGGSRIPILNTQPAGGGPATSERGQSS